MAEWKSESQKSEGHAFYQLSIISYPQTATCNLQPATRSLLFYLLGSCHDHCLLGSHRKTACPLLQCGAKWTDYCDTWPLTPLCYNHCRPPQQSETAFLFPAGALPKLGCLLQAPMLQNGSQYCALMLVPCRAPYHAAEYLLLSSSLESTAYLSAHIFFLH